MTRLAVAAFLVALPAVAQDKPNRHKDPLAVGGPMPALIVQFHTGAHPHGGDPGVMIANTKAKGVVVWTKTADAPALALAKALDGLVDDTKTRGFLVVFDETEDVVKGKVKAEGYKRLSAGWARKKSAEFFPRAGVPDATYVVSLVDGDKVTQVWQFKAGELTEAKQKAIADAVAALAAK